MKNERKTNENHSGNAPETAPGTAPEGYATAAETRTTTHPGRNLSNDAAIYRPVSAATHGHQPGPGTRISRTSAQGTAEVPRTHDGDAETVYYKCDAPDETHQERPNTRSSTHVGGEK